MDFSGKKILLTGAAGGIGKAVKKLFEDSGGLVALADRDLSQFQSGLKLEGDLSDPEHASNLALEAVRVLGGWISSSIMLALCAVVRLLIQPMKI